MGREEEEGVILSEGGEKTKDLKEKTLKRLGLGYPKKVVNPRGGMFGERKASKAKKQVDNDYLR